jgi:hypothetical protein
MPAAESPRHITEGIRTINRIVDQERRGFARIGILFVFAMGFCCATIWMRERVNQDEKL